MGVFDQPFDDLHMKKSRIEKKIFVSLSTISKYAIKP